MAQIKINDIFEELIEENTEITECLNVLIKFKTFVDLISSKLKSNLGSNELQMFEDFHKEVEEVFKRNKRNFSVNRNLIENKTQISEYLSSKSQTTDSNRLQLSSKSCKQSKVKGFKSGLMSKTSKVVKQIKQKITEGKDFSLDENQMFVCSFIGCGKRFDTREKVRRHLITHSTIPKPFVCDFDGCGFATNRRTTFRYHINGHKGIKPFSCDYCEKQFSSDYNRKTHIDLIHKVSDQILICELEECYKQFRTERQLKNHQKFHSLEKRLVCTQPNCTFKTIIASALKNHISSVHSDDRPFVCPHEGCSRSYKLKFDLSKHMLTHSSERNFKCLFEGCGKAFKTRSILRNHTIIHSDIELRCDWPGCEYTTKHSNSLIGHQSVHKSERNFGCNWPECGKRFKNKTQLGAHIRVHKNDKRYACSWPGCQYKCTDSGNLIKHRRIHLKN